MDKEIYNLVRATMLILVILIFAVLCLTDPSRQYPEHTEPAYLEEEPEIATTAPTEAPQPRETEPPTETTAPENEPPAATEPPTEPETEPTDTEAAETMRDVELLAIVIYTEAGGDDCVDFTRLGVGTAAWNRVGDPRFPNSLHGVLTQEAQYGTMDRTGVVWPERASDPAEAHAVERAYTIAERIILEGVRVFDADVVFQAEFPQGTEVVAYSDGMYFCR